MATIKQIIEGASVRQTLTEMSITDVYFMDDMTPGVSIMEDALATDGLPQMNAYHPRQTTLRVQSRDVETPGGHFAVLVRVTYSNAQPGGGGGNTGGPQTPDDPARASVGAVVSAEERDFDSSDVQIIVKEFTNNEDPPTKYAKQTRSIQVLVPQVTRRYVRITTSDPQAVAMEYVGKVNSRNWNGGPAYTWLCTGINGETDDYGQTWTVTYDFQYQSQVVLGLENGWNKIITAIDTTTGNPATGAELPPAGQSEGQGTLWVSPYKTINFGALNL